MAFERPTLQQLVDRAVADIESRLPGADARLRRSNLNVLARMHAGAVHGLYGYLDNIAKQLIYDTASAEYLERWAAIWGLARIAAAAATGTVGFTGVNGTLIPAGSLLQRSDGAEFTTTADATIVAGVASAAVVASVAGAAGNTAAATVLSITTPVAGANTAATVDGSSLGGGADAETDDSLRARLLARIQLAPHGGAADDYVAWAREVAGVTRAWCYPQELGPGTVTVRFVRDDDANLIPDAGEVANVQAYIDARRPVTAAATVVAPIADPLNFTIDLTPDTAAVRAAVQAELQDLLRREAAPEGGHGEGVVLLSHIRAAISSAAGEQNYVMSAPVADVAPTAGQIVTFGAITWL